ncbi:MAG TPA: DUF1598 domain-containing protein, partial [Thermoanaerobaculia bacterium]|nr:DUF1598 domain-containing protein [Thermoanaerobaculia bacterium]
MILRLCSACLGLALAVALGCADAPAGGGAVQGASEPQADGRRAAVRTVDAALHLCTLSLRQLALDLEACVPAGSCAEPALAFGGLTRVLGYVIDRVHHDVVVYGLAEPGAARIRTEDFVVALRSSWHLYGSRRGDTFFYSDPGCDIRPTPDTMSELRDLGREVEAPTAAAQEEALHRWQDTCQLPQRVSVLGVPVDSEFGRTMVAADYDMKRLADGTDPLAQPGMISVADLE